MAAAAPSIGAFEIDARPGRDAVTGEPSVVLVANMFGGEPRSIEFALPAATARELGWRLLEVAGAIEPGAAQLDD